MSANDASQERVRTRIVANAQRHPTSGAPARPLGQNRAVQCEVHSLVFAQIFHSISELLCLRGPHA